MEIRVTFDANADAGMIYLADIDPGGVARTVEAVPGSIMLDFDPDGRLIGIEVLDAKRRLPKQLLNQAERI